ARVQCVVASAAPTDLEHLVTGRVVPFVFSFIGMLPPWAPTVGSDSLEARTYRDASPINHVSAEAAPFLLLHGDADSWVPFEQSELIRYAMKLHAAEVRLIRLPGAEHGFPSEVSRHPDWPDFLSETVRWLNIHLKTT